MGDLLNPIYNFDFEVLEKGTYKFKIKETGIESQAEGKSSGKRYWARCIVVGGSQDGGSHMEGFFENTKDNFSLRRLAGFLVKLGVIKDPSRIDSDAFKSAAFEEKWLKAVPGKEFGAKIGHRSDPKDKDKVYSDMRAYYSLDEYMALKGGGASAATSQVVPDTAPPANSVWD